MVASPAATGQMTLRHLVETAQLGKHGLLKGASDLIVIFPNGKLCFVELKIAKGIQSNEQKDFEQRVSDAGYEYHLIRSLEEFIILTNNNI